MTSTRSFRTLSVAVVLGCLSTTVLALGVAQAATGGDFILGHKNAAGQPTTLTNRGSGPALRLRAGDGAPPLAVGSTAKVENLNADLLDGVTRRDLQRRIDGACAAGQVMLNVWLDGGVNCAPDNVDGGEAVSVTGAGVIRSALQPDIPTEAVLWQEGEVRLRAFCETQQTNDNLLRIWVDNDGTTPVYVGWQRDAQTGATSRNWAPVTPGGEQTLLTRTGGGQSAPIADLLGEGSTFSIAASDFTQLVSGDLGFSLGVAEPADACIVLARLDVD